MPRLEDLSDTARQGHLNFPAMEHDDAPFAPLGKPLPAAKLALVTTAGLHLRGDAPFASGDQTYRVIPSSSAAADIIQSHTSIGFDRTAIMRDINVTFPIDRLRELVDRGTLGELSARFYSFLGANRDPKRIIEETGPEVAGKLLDEGVDAVLLTPT